MVYPAMEMRPEEVKTKKLQAKASDAWGNAAYFALAFVMLGGFSPIFYLETHETWAIAAFIGALLCLVFFIIWVAAAIYYRLLLDLPERLKQG